MNPSEPNCQDCGKPQGTGFAECNTCKYMAGVLGFRVTGKLVGDMEYAKSLVGKIHDATGTFVAEAVIAQEGIVDENGDMFAPGSLREIKNARLIAVELVHTDPRLMAPGTLAYQTRIYVKRLSWWRRLWLRVRYGERN